MFALSWLERHNELTALLAAGITRWRIAKPTIFHYLREHHCNWKQRIRSTFNTICNLHATRSRWQDSKVLKHDMTMKLKYCFVGNRTKRLCCVLIHQNLLMPPCSLNLVQIDAANAIWKPTAKDTPQGIFFVKFPDLQH